MLPEPEMQLKRMKPGTSKVELTLNTRKGSMQAAMVGASLVKMPTMGTGNIHRSIHKGTMDTTAMRGGAFDHGHYGFTMVSSEKVGGEGGGSGGKRHKGDEHEVGDGAHHVGGCQFA